MSNEHEDSSYADIDKTPSTTTAAAAGADSDAQTEQGNMSIRA
jgi:hypothetical protein